VSYVAGSAGCGTSNAEREVCIPGRMLLLDLAQTLALQAAPLASDVELMLVAAVPGVMAVDPSGSSKLEAEVASTVDCEALLALDYLLQHAQNRQCVYTYVRSLPRRSTSHIPVP